MLLASSTKALCPLIAPSPNFPTTHTALASSEAWLPGVWQKAVVAQTGHVCVERGTVIGPVHMWPIGRIDERLAEKAPQLSKELRVVPAERGAPLREWLELGGTEERRRWQRRANWVPPSKRIEYYIEAVAARPGLGRSALEMTLPLYRGWEGGVGGEVAEGDDRRHIRRHVYPSSRRGRCTGNEPDLGQRGGVQAKAGGEDVHQEEHPRAETYRGPRLKPRKRMAG